MEKYYIKSLILKKDFKKDKKECPLDYPKVTLTA